MNALKHAILLSIACLSCLQIATPTAVRACENILKPDNIEIKDCDKEPCNVKLGETISMNFTFISPNLYERIKPSVVATTMGIDVPYPIGDDACPSIINTPCPIAEGEFISYNFNFYVLKIIPEISLNLRFSLKDLDRNETEIICFQTNLQVVH